MVKTLPVPSRRKCLNPRTPPPPHTHTPGLKVTVKDEVRVRQFYAWLDKLPTILSINLSQKRITITIYNRILKV